MSDRPSNPSPATTAAAMQFVTDLMAGRRPSIEAALDAVPPAEWPGLLHSLLIAEVNDRRSRGEYPLAREYLPRFPAHANVVRAVLPDVPVTGRLVSVSGPAPAPAAVPRPAAPVPPPVQPAVTVAWYAEPSAVPPVAPAAVPLAVPISGPVPAAVVLPRAFEDFAPEPDPAPSQARRPRKKRRLRLAAGALLLLAGGTVAYLTIPRGRTTENPQPPPDGKGPVVVSQAPKAAPKLKLPPPSGDPERDLGEWVLALGGTGTLSLEAGGRRPFTADAPLPKGKFAITGLALPPEAAARWTAADLERLRGRPALASVQLHHPAALTDAALEPLTGLPLRVLELHGNPVEVTGASVAKFPELETLTLMSAPNFGDADLAAVGKLPKLKSFAVNTPKLTPAGFKELKNPQLRSLTFGEAVALTANHVRLMLGLPLEELESGAGMTDDAFLEFAVFPNIRRFRLRKTALTDAGLKTVVGLGKLEELVIDGSNVTGPGLDHLAERPGLKVLDLSRSKLTDEAVAKLIALPNLRELRLAGCPLSDQCVMLLAQLDALQILDLGETRVTDAALGILKKHQTLKSLILTGTKVTPAAARDFEQATPNCKVVLGTRK